MSDENEVKTNKLYKVFEKWILFRIPAFLFWYWLVSLIIKDFSGSYFQYADKYLLLSILVSEIILVFLKKWIKLFGLLLYVLAFPLLFPFILISLLSKVLTLVFKTPAYSLKTIFCDKTFVLNILLLTVFWLLLVKIENPLIESYLALSILITNLIFLAHLFYVAINPLYFLYIFQKVIWRISEPIICICIKKWGHLLFKDKSYKSYLETLDTAVTRVNDKTSNLLDKFNKHKLLLVPLIAFVFLLIFTYFAISIGVCAFKIGDFYGPLLNISEYTSSVFDFIYTTALLMLTILPNNVSPNGVLGQLFILFSVLHGIMIISLLLSGFFAMLSSDNNISKETFSKLIEEMNRDVEKWKQILIDEQQGSVKTEAVEIKKGKED